MVAKRNVTAAPPASADNAENISFTEFGATGLRQFSGYVREEWLRELIGWRGQRMYREMRDNDPIIGAMFFAIEFLLRGVDFKFEPASTKPDDIEAADFCQSCMTDLEQTWPELISEILTFLQYGWCLPPDQIVTMADGTVKRADAVATGDMLLTKHGRGRPVTKIFTRRHTGKMMRIRTRGYPHPIRMTPEHKLPTVRGWVTAGELVAGDIVLRPRPKMEAGGDYDSGWIVGLYLAEGSRDGDRNRVTFSLHSKEVDEVEQRCNAWAVARDLKPYQSRDGGRPSPVTARAQRGFPGLTGGGYSGANSGRVSFSHPEFRALIDEWAVGDDSWTKALSRLPTDEAFAQGVLDGWVYGDGHRGVNAVSDTEIAAAFTVSKNLGHQMQMIAGALGLPSPLSYRVGGTQGTFGTIPGGYTVGVLPQREMRWKRSVEANERVHMLRAGGMTMHAIAAEVGMSYTSVFKWLHSDGPKTQGLQCKVFQQTIGHEVTDITAEDYNGDVYDFTVDEDHTFCAGPIIVSNCVHEIVYKTRSGRSNDPQKNSRYDDGMIGWRKFAGRAQETLLHWVFDESGDPIALVQLLPTGGPLLTVPLGKCLHFKTRLIKNNPEGVSIMRNAYTSYFFKKRIQMIEAIGVERDLTGLPVMWVPARLMNANASPEDKAQLAALKVVVRDTVRNEQEGFVLPMAYDKDGHELYKMELLATGGRRQFATNEIIDRYDHRIAATLLADFITIGSGSSAASGRGSSSMSKNKSQMFSVAVGGFLDLITAEFNRKSVPDLLTVNGLKGQCKMAHGEIAKDDLDKVAAYITAAIGTGAIMPDPVLEAYLREEAGWPAQTGVSSGAFNDGGEDQAGGDTTDSTTDSTDPADAQGQGQGDDDPAAQTPAQKLAKFRGRRARGFKFT